MNTAITYLGRESTAQHQQSFHLLAPGSLEDALRTSTVNSHAAEGHPVGLYATESYEEPSLPGPDAVVLSHSYRGKIFPARFVTEGEGKFRQLGSEPIVIDPTKIIDRRQPTTPLTRVIKLELRL